MGRTGMIAVGLLSGLLLLASGATANPLQEADLTYLGAFAGGASNIAYSAHTGIAYNPGGGSSGYGSFYICGTGSGIWLGEFENVDESLLQKRSDGATYPTLAIGATLATTSGSSGRRWLLGQSITVGMAGYGLEYIPAFGNQTTDKVYGSNAGYGNTNSYTELDGTLGPRDTNSDAVAEYGPWSITTTPGYDVRRPGYGLTQIPQDWVDANLPDANYKLAIAGNGAYGTYGPAIVAYRPTDANGDVETGTSNPGVVLLQPSSSNRYAGQDDDRWEGLAWVENSQFEACIVSGRKDLETDPSATDNLTPWLLLYDPADLAAVVADGTSAAWDDPLPYAEIDLSQYWFNTTTTQTNQRTAYGLEYVPEMGRLYILEYNAHDEPIIHVFEVVPEPATLTLFGLGVLPLLRRRRRK